MADKTGKICSISPLNGSVTPCFTEYLNFAGSTLDSLGEIKGAVSLCLNEYINRDGKIAEIRPLFRKNYVEILGSCSGTVELSGTLDVLTIILISGSISASCELSGTLDIIAILQIEGGISASVELSGLLEILTMIPLSGGISSQITLSGILLVRTSPYGWPPTRWSDYDPDLVYDETNDIWTDEPDILQVGGGRYQERLVTVNSNGEVYFG